MTVVDRASCQSCGNITIWTGDRRCAYCDGELQKIGVVYARRPSRSDNNRTRWTDLRREQVIEAYAQGHNIPEIANAIWESMGYANPATARAAIRQEFRRMNVTLRPPRKCAVKGCRRDPLTGDPRCFSHSTERAEQRLEIGEIMRAAQANFPRVGETHHTAKISEADARAIRQSDAPTQELAERYGITPGHVARIRVGRVWAHLEAA